MTSYIALLRGINLGRTRKVGMSELRGLLRSKGYRDARTYIQSGNILLTSDLAADELAAQLERALEERFEMPIPVLVRTREELQAVVDGNPLAGVASDNARFYAIFLDRDPDADRVAAIDPAVIGPERFELRDRVIYAWYPTGLHVSKLAGMLTDGRLGVTTTARNWNTVTRLLALSQDAAQASDEDD